MQKQTAIGTVNVVVEYLPEEAVTNAGSIRIRGMTPEEFLGLQGSSDSPYQRLRIQIAQLLKIDQKNVQIFSLQPFIPPNSYQPTEPHIDVHFAAFGSPYKSSVLLNGLLDLNKIDVEGKFGGNAKIVLVNIDPCVDETCVSGGCNRKVIVNSMPAVVMANATSLVGVSLNVTSVCECPRTEVPTTCQLKGKTPSCFNAGICHPMGKTPPNGENTDGFL